MQVKNKVKQNLKQSKGCACETPLVEVFFFPGNGARILACRFAGAKLTGERVFDVGASSSSVPGNGARKLLDGTVMMMLESLIAFVDEVK
jgi:hypothetical protein